MSPALAFAALASTAGGIVAHGLFFLARRAYGFDDADNLWLAVALFLPYLPAALLAGPAARRFGTRTTLYAANLVMIGAGLVLAARPPAAWVWLAAPLYNGAAGLLWPLVEGYVAGGQHGPGLHRAIGTFNLTWSLTLVPALWIVGAAGSNVTVPFAILVVLHLVGALAIARLPPQPPPLDHAATESVGPDYPRLLRSSRILLPVSYLLLDALAPLLPSVWERLGVDGALAPGLTSVWMLARVATFAALVSWSGWRGRGLALAVGAAALLGGFALALGGAAIPSVVAGLIAFGIGQGIVYYAALYYGMAVGKGEIDSGGRHEAVIGLGYLGGPAVALAGLSVGVAPLVALGAIAAVGFGAAWVPWRRRRTG